MEPSHVHLDIQVEMEMSMTSIRLKPGIYNMPTRVRVNVTRVYLPVRDGVLHGDLGIYWAREDFYG